MVKKKEIHIEVAYSKDYQSIRSGRTLVIEDTDKPEDIVQAKDEAFNACHTDCVVELDKRIQALKASNSPVAKAARENKLTKVDSEAMDTEGDYL